MDINIIKEGANKVRKVTRIESLAQEYINVKDDNATDVAKELKDTCKLAVVNAIKAYMHATVGLEKYAEAIDKALDVEEVEFRLECATTKDEKSVEYVIGKALNGNVSVVGDILAKVVGSKVRTLDKQIRALFNDVVNSRVWRKDSDMSNFELLVPMMFETHYPSIFADKELLARVYDVTKEAIRSGKYDKKKDE